MYQGANVKRKRNPRERANILNILAFFYATDIFKKSRKRDLIEDDLYETFQNTETQLVGDQLENEWNKETKQGRNSLTRALIRVFGKTYLYYGLFVLIVKCTLLTIHPLSMGRLVSYFSAGSTMTQDVACFYGSVLLLCAIISSILLNQYNMLMGALGLKLKAALISLIYRKSLKLNSISLMEVTSGKLVTLISKDVNAFESAVNCIHDLWVGLLQLMIVSYLLYQQIQEAGFIGVVLLIILIPIQVLIAKLSKIMRLKMGTKTDERLKRMQEILTSIKLLKMYNWTDYYAKLTNKLRREEMNKLRLIFYLKSIVFTLSICCQRFSFYVCIIFYIYQGHIITAEQVFVVIDCYSKLELCMTLPLCVSQFAEIRSAMKRIKQCLLSGNVPPSENTVEEHKRSTGSIKVQNAQVDYRTQSILRNIHFWVESPCLVALTGSVGSGKSTLLKMLINDIHVSSGFVNVTGTVSYASQVPWLFPATIKQNILFGQEYDEDRYHNVLRCTALIKDLELFPLKDNTVVSDKGLNLSKGQQARINLARAIYKHADIYLLDDVLVSLDAKVGNHVFENCIKDFLKGKLVILICHDKKYLQHATRILVLGDKTIGHEGTYDDLVKNGVDFNQMAHIESSLDTWSKPITYPEDDNNVDRLTTLDLKDTADLRLYQEFKEEGSVKWSVYKSYLDNAGGWKILFLVLILFAFAQAFASYFDYFASDWLAIEERISALNYNITNNLTNLTFESEIFIKARDAHVWTIYTYTFLVLMMLLSTIVLAFTFFAITCYTSKNLHNKIFTIVTQATMSFYDANLSGNILNRFAKDMGIIDERIPFLLLDSLRILFFSLGICVVVCYMSPILIAPTGIMMAMLFILMRQFLAASRGLKRLDGSTRAPVIGFLNSSLEGLTTIRASGNQAILKSQFERHQDLNTSALYMYTTIKFAFILWLDLLCKIYAAFIIYSSIFLVDKGEGIAGKVGVTISLSTALMGILQWGIRQWSELENQMTSVERINEYALAEPEKRSGLINNNNWNEKARQIEYRNVSMSYETNQKILQNVNVVIKPGERVGIIGRTGAGKSSIISALFRLYQIEGSIIIDEMDISDIELYTVRSKMTIIPQDPVLFAGTIRTNLDPYAQFTDARLWQVLKEVELKSDISNLDDGLNSVVEEGGANFSVGQRQLISLARAILRDNKILILDEATANIDPKTDDFVHKTIKRLFSNCTTLTIAHRLHTVIDSDRIIVLDEGKVVDFDTPRNLIERRDGIFYKMAQEVGLTS